MRLGREAVEEEGGGSGDGVVGRVEEGAFGFGASGAFVVAAAFLRAGGNGGLYGIHGRLSRGMGGLATAVLPACGEAGRIKGGGGQGRSLRAVRRMGWGMMKAMGEVWEIHLMAFHSFSILTDGSERPSLPEAAMAGTVAPRRPANGSGMMTAMEEVWKLIHGFPFAFHSRGPPGG